MDKRFIRKNGSIVWTRLTVSAARDGSGKTQYLIGVVEDISERKSAEEKLRDSETLMRGIISSMPTLLLAIDEDGRVVFWNAECERVTGFGAEEVVGADDVWGRLMPDMFGLQSVSEIFGGKDGEFRNVEYEIRDKSGGKTLYFLVPSDGENSHTPRCHLDRGSGCHGSEERRRSAEGSVRASGLQQGRWWIEKTES